MNRVFPIPDAIVVPDGTKLYELVGPQVLNKNDLRINDGVSVAIGELPAGIRSKVHVHPVVWHFTWVRTGTLTVKMKDAGSTEPYQLTVPKDHGVLTEPGTFFQLINDTDRLCETYYIVGPAFVFEMNDEGSVEYNDAVVFDHSWEDLANFDWNPPDLPSHWEQFDLRRNSLRRIAQPPHLNSVHHVRWQLKNGPGSVSVPAQLHNVLTKPHDVKKFAEPLRPTYVGIPPKLVDEMLESFLDHLQSVMSVKVSDGFKNGGLASIANLRCSVEPAVLYEFEMAAQLYASADRYLAHEEIWHLLLFGINDDLGSEYTPTALNLARYHVFNDLLTFSITIGGGFKSAGTMENYRAYLGGKYSDPKSYRHYQPAEE